MNKREKYELCMNIRRMKKIIDEGEAKTMEAENLRRVLNGDKDHTPEWKAKRGAEIANIEQSAYRHFGTIAATMQDYFQGLRQSAENSFDYADPELQQALTTINGVGKALPVAVQNQIVERFRGNPTALSVLRPVFEKHSFNTDTIDTLSRPFKTPDFDVEEIYGAFIGRATCPAEIANATWQPDSVKSLLSSYEKTFGLDTSENPYLSEIKQLQETTRDHMKAARIRLFLRMYGDDLADDRNEPVRAAEMELENGFLTPEPTKK